MKEIKSFREYIEEQKSLKANLIVEDGDEETKEQKASTVKSPAVGTNLLVTNDKLAITSKTPASRLEELRKKALITRKTYDELDEFVDASGFDNGDTSNPSTVFNLTNKRSFDTIYKEWYEKYKQRLESQKTNRENVADVNELMRNKVDVFLHGKSAKDSQEKARENLEGRYPVEKEEDIKEEVINELFRIRPLTTVGELSSGSKNRHNSDRILTAISRSKAGRERDRLGKKGVYGDLDKGMGISGKSKLAKMKEDYENDARVIIARQKGVGLSYLKKAEKELAYYIDNKKYLRKITDEEYLAKISTYLNQAMSVLYDIGRDLQRLMNEYENSLNKISNELSTQDVKNEKYITGLNAKQAISNYDIKMSKKAKKEGDKQEAEDIEKGKAAEKEEFHKAIVDAVQKEIDEAKEVDKKAAVYFLNELGKVESINEITPESLLKKLEKDSARKSKSGSDWNEVDRLAAVKGIYALAKFLSDNSIRDFNVGKNSYTPNTSPEKINRIYDLISPITASKDELVEKTKEFLLSPEELRKIEAQKDAESNSERLNKESEGLRRITDRAEGLALNFINNNKNLSYQDVYDRVKHDIKFGDDEYSKVKNGYTPEEQEKSSALASYLLSVLLNKNKIEKVIKKGLDSSDTYEPFKNALKLIDLNKKIKTFNKSLLKILKKKIDDKERLGAISDTGRKPSDEQIKNVEKRSKELEAAGAKDFEGEKPAEPAAEPEAKNIFDYAVQKAKRLQEK